MMDINSLTEQFENDVVQLVNSSQLPYCIKRIALEKIVLIIKNAEAEARIKSAEAEKKGED